MKHFEYKTESIPDNQSLVQFLNYWGQDGWEYVKETMSGNVILKRERTDLNVRG